MIRLKNPQNNQLMSVPVGFSWTTLFFGIFVPLFRGDVKWFLGMLLLVILGAFFFLPVVPIIWLIFPFIYNKIYLKSLLQKGYVPADDESREYLINKNFIAP